MWSVAATSAAPSKPTRSDSRANRACGPYISVRYTRVCVYKDRICKLDFKKLSQHRGYIVFSSTLNLAAADTAPICHMWEPRIRL